MGSMTRFPFSFSFSSLFSFHSNVSNPLEEKKKRREGKKRTLFPFNLICFQRFQGVLRARDPQGSDSKGTYLTGSSWEISFMEDLVSKRFPGTGISFEIHLSDGSPRVPGGHTRFPCRPACQSKDWEIVCPRPPGHPMGSSRTLSTSGSLRPSRPGSFPFKPLVPAHVTDLYGGNLSTA